MQHSESITKLAAALTKVQGEIEHAHKNATNPHFKNKYADLTEVIDTTRPVLAKHGVSVVQFPGYVDGVTTLETVLLHESGEWISGTAGARMQKDDPQGVGSALTYLRRYSLAAVCGIGQDDDDGEAAVRGAPAQRQAAQPIPRGLEPSYKPVEESGGEPQKQAVPNCPKCGGAMWDNRPKKLSGEFKAGSPDFACKDKACKHSIWEDKKESGPAVDSVKLQDLLNRAVGVDAINFDQAERVEKVINEGKPDEMQKALTWLETQMAKKKLT